MIHDHELLQPEPDRIPVSRRWFLRASGLIGVTTTVGAATIGGTLLAGCRKESDNGGDTSRAKTKEAEGEEVTPGEDLMREHGILKRVVLVYRHYIELIDAGGELPPKPLADAAYIIRSFIEDYHERLEEQHLFPRFRSAHQLVDLVDVLDDQHKAGRRSTDAILSLATPSALGDATNRAKLRGQLAGFTRMYEPHEAREDTVLFPAFAKLVSRHEYDALGEDFEKEEHRLFGEDGFERMVSQVEVIETALGIYDLKQFTPTS